jgi:hypothetical protein
VKADKRTFEELSKAAGEVFECLEFTSDSPSSHEEGKVPVLDLQVYVSQQGTIIHEFYEKPVSCKLVIPASSAHSKKTKIAVMVEEGVRRLRNHSQGMESQATKKCLVKWAKKLRRSGYPVTFRHQVITAAVGRFRRLVQDEVDGIRPVHRPRNWRRRDRKLAKECKRSNWHNKAQGQVSAPLIVDPVPGDMLDKMKSLCSKFE